jgi:hypothetical protein
VCARGIAAVHALGTVTNDVQREYNKLKQDYAGKQHHRKRSPRPKKLKRGQSNVRQMMNFAYDSKGVVMTVTAANHPNFFKN